jgi:hypothetical protein
MGSFYLQAVEEGKVSVAHKGAFELLRKRRNENGNFKRTFRPRCRPRRVERLSLKPFSLSIKAVNREM